MKYSGIGGQAVIEGVMMKNGSEYAVSVRKPDGEIAVMKDSYIGFGDRHGWAKLPFVRGVFNFIDSLIIGMKTLTYSASFFEDDDTASEPSGFEKWMTKTFGDRAEQVLTTVIMILSFAVAIIVFMWLPLTLVELLSRLVHFGTTVRSLLEGLVRVLIFIGYIKLISRMEDIRRTFMYHGAEHKCINCIEHGLELNVDNAAASSKEHKRCGTSFIVIVMMISILLFMVIRVESIPLRFLSRIILIPVIAGISYELLRIAGRYDNTFVNIISRPGMWMQGLTTYEPDREMLEVAIASVNAVFDWKAYLKENFPEKSGGQSADGE